jgi:hypothetical protein
MYQLIMKARTGNEVRHASKAVAPRRVDNRCFPSEVLICDGSDCDVSILSLHLPFENKRGVKVCTTTTDPVNEHPIFLLPSGSTEASVTTTSVPDEIVDEQGGQQVKYNKYKLFLRGDGGKRKKEKPFWEETRYYDHGDDHVHGIFQFCRLDSIEDLRERV